MQSKTNGLVLGVLLLAGFNVSAESFDYLGIDYNVVSMQGRDEGNYAMRLVFPQTYHGYEAYYAHRFANDVGLGISWAQTGTTTEYHTFAANEMFLGDTQAAGDRTVIGAKIQALHIDLIGYININPAWEAIGQIGAAWMRVKTNGTVFASGVATNMMPSSNFENFIPRISFGLQYITSYKIGVRAIVNWQGTNLYRMSLNDEDGARSKIKPFRQSWVYGLGIVGKF